MIEYLSKLAIEKIWCVPDQDLQFRTKIKRLSGNIGSISKVTVLWDSLDLPTKTDRYHVFQVGHIDLKLTGLDSIKYGWNKLTDIVNNSDLFCNIFYLDGMCIPKSLTWFHFDISKNLIVAIRDDSNFGRLSTEEPYLRIYSNAFFRSERKTSEDMTYTVGHRVVSATSILDIQTLYHEYMSKTGECIAYHNGYFISDFNPSVVRIGDYVEFDYDSSIYKVINLSVPDLHTFVSILDERRKYLLAYGSMTDYDGQIIDYRDDIDVFLVNTSTPVRRGCYYHSLSGDYLRMVTHRDYSIPVDYINSYVQSNPKFFNNVNSVDIVLYIRKTGMTRPLVNNASKIHELYKLDTTKRIRAMVGLDSTVDVWRAENLENSEYCKLMSSKLPSVTTPVIYKTLGYNAISKLVGDTPIKAVNGSEKQIKLKVGQVESCTIFEYDSNGLLIDYSTSKNTSIYRCKNLTTDLTEVIIGEGGLSREYIVNVNSAVIDPKFNYRVYLCANTSTGPNFNWIDITNTSRVTFNGSIINIDYNPITEYVTILSDEKFLTYDLMLNKVDGVYKFSINELEKLPSGDVSLVSRIPTADVTIWLNGHTLIKDIDYAGTWPEFYIYNKAYLIDNEPQHVVVRCTGFCSDQMEVYDNDHKGFVKHGFLSSNWKYDITEDKVMSVVVDGKLKTLNDVSLIDSSNGVLVNGSRNGAPYEIKETYVPLRGAFNINGYVLRELARYDDNQISNYLTLNYPQPVIPALNTIVDRYKVYSLFLTRLHTACIEGEFDTSKITGFYSDEVIREILEPYLHLLEIEPALTSRSDFMVTEPFPNKTLVDMDIYHHNFLQRVIKIYLNGSVNLSTFVRITLPTE